MVVISVLYLAKPYIKKQIFKWFLLCLVNAFAKLLSLVRVSRVRHIQERDRGGILFCILVRSRVLYCFPDAQLSALLRKVSRRSDIKAKWVEKWRESYNKSVTSVWGSSPICGQYGIKKEEGKGDTARCRAAAYLRFTKEAGQVSWDHIRTPGMHSVLQVFYNDLWLPNACRRVKRSGHSSASWTSEGAHMGKGGVREAEVLHFQAKVRQEFWMLERAPELSLLAAPIWVLSHHMVITEKDTGLSCNHDKPKASSHTMVKHPAHCLWLVSQVQCSCLTWGSDSSLHLNARHLVKASS